MSAKSLLRRSCFVCLILVSALAAGAQPPAGCRALPGRRRLRSALQAIVKQGPRANGGLGNQEWAVLVNRQGIVCAVVYSGSSLGQQWPGSRLIAAEKANTANSLSGPDFALSTANLFFPAQPGQSLYSLVGSAPPNPKAVFGDPTTFGTSKDPMVGKPIGGVIVFGGGLPLYTHKGKIVGGLGLSGDTSCTDHVIAWKLRHALHLDAVPMGVSPEHNDNMIQDIKNGKSASGWGHPVCKGGQSSSAIIQKLPQKYPTRP